MNREQELELVEKAKVNIHAFDELYRYFMPKIYGFLLNRTGSKEISEDITSQIFISAVKTISKFDTSKGFKFSTWLYRVTQNKLIDHYRKNKFQFEDIENHNILSDEDVEREIVISDTNKKIAFVLSLIKDRYQEVIALKYFSQMDNNEIAEVMDVKPSNVAVILHRALTSFKEKFEKNFSKSEIADLF